MTFIPKFILNVLRLTPWLPCYYGTAHTSVMANYEMTFAPLR